MERLNAQVPPEGESLRDTIARRVAFVREQHPQGIRTPSKRLLLGELRSLYRGGYRGQAVTAAARPMPVMLLPGFCTHPFRMTPMADALRAAGHCVYDWGLGFNMGSSARKFSRLMDRVARIASEGAEPVALVGWSLGGVFAREVARQQPECVAKVITMGSPFSGDRHANNAWRAYQLITGHTVDTPPVECHASKPPVPTIALWSPRDGIVDPRAAAGWLQERDRAVAIRCTHLDFAGAPQVVAEVLRQLDVEE